jgi:hypothetical protein
MGDNFLKGQQANFKKGRDLSLAEAVRPRLWVRPEIISTVYTAVPSGCEQYVEGEILDAAVDRREAQVSLLRGHRKAGWIEGEGAQKLLETLVQSGVRSLIRVKITEVGELSGMAKVVISEQQYEDTNTFQHM